MVDGFGASGDCRMTGDKDAEIVPGGTGTGA